MAQISCAVLASYIVEPLYFLNPKPLAIFCGRIARFLSDLFGNPEDDKTGFLAMRLNDDHSIVSGCPDCPKDKMCMCVDDEAGSKVCTCECRPEFVENDATGECTWCQGK